MAKFIAKKAIELSGVTIFKAFKFGLIFLAIAFIAYSIYATAIKPHFNPIKTQEQKAEQITNITEVRQEGLSISLFPPKFKCNFSFKIFDFEK